VKCGGSTRWRGESTVEIVLQQRQECSRFRRWLLADPRIVVAGRHAARADTIMLRIQANMFELHLPKPPGGGASARLATHMARERFGSIPYPPGRIRVFCLTSFRREPRGRRRSSRIDYAKVKRVPTLMKEPWAVPPQAAPLQQMRSDRCCRHTLRSTATAAAVVALQVTS
jgi:hypothetical protein